MEVQEKLLMTHDLRPPGFSVEGLELVKPGHWKIEPGPVEVAVAGHPSDGSLPAQGFPPRPVDDPFQDCLLYTSFYNDLAIHGARVDVEAYVREWQAKNEIYQQQSRRYWLCLLYTSRCV